MKRGVREEQFLENRYITSRYDLEMQALELASRGTVEADYKDWWWKSRLGKCYYQVGVATTSNIRAALVVIYTALIFS